MWKDFRFYFIAFVATLGLFILANSSWVPEFLRTVATFFGISGFTSIVIEAWRDKRAHERALEIQGKQNTFTLGIASEMASITFGKHVAFAEAYSSKLYETIKKLGREGPTDTVFEDSKALKSLRTKYSVWLTREIELKLIPFEQALENMAMNVQLARIYKDPGPERSFFIDAMMNEFRKVIPIDTTTAQTEDEAAISVIAHLRKVLSIHELILLRQKAIDEAAKELVR
jgi:hypothetical protein